MFVIEVCRWRSCYLVSVGRRVVGGIAWACKALFSLGNQFFTRARWTPALLFCLFSQGQIVVRSAGKQIWCQRFCILPKFHKRVLTDQKQHTIYKTFYPVLYHT